MMHSTSPITIVGAGFSGLTTAYYLTRKGIPCELYEKNMSPGGLISSVQCQNGIAENGALTLMASEAILELCKELNVDMVAANPQHKKRFFFRQGLKQWPLTAFETLQTFCHVLKTFITHKFKIAPEKYETLFAWAKRVFGIQMGEYFLFPALQGIYAGNPKEMSATLILNKQKLKYKGLYAPVGGMENLIHKLVQYLASSNVKIHYNILFEDRKDNRTIVWCTNAQDNPLLSNQIKLLPIASVTMFFPKTNNSPTGFGCLFPRNQNMHSLGVLYNSNIFNDRARQDYVTETWLLGGAEFDVSNLNEEQILDIVKNDRKILRGKNEEPAEFHIKKWNKALPHYNIQLEKLLEELKVPENQYIHGNFVAGIGLSKILENSKQIAERIYDEKLRVS